MIHIMPVDDLREHEKSLLCWCEPRIEEYDTNGAPLIESMAVHNSADGREAVERETGMTTGKPWVSER